LLIPVFIFLFDKFRGRVYGSIKLKESDHVEVNGTMQQGFLMNEVSGGIIIGST
jgi:hypothetical protein